MLYLGAWWVVNGLGLVFRFDFRCGGELLSGLIDSWGAVIWVLGWIVGFSGLVAGFGMDLMVVSLGFGVVLFWLDW